MFGLFGRSAPVKTDLPPEAHQLAGDGKVLPGSMRARFHEWAAGHAPGAYHAPLSKLAQTATAIPTDKPVVFLIA